MHVPYKCSKFPHHLELFISPVFSSFMEFIFHFYYYQYYFCVFVLHFVYLPNISSVGVYVSE